MAAGRFAIRITEDGATFHCPAGGWVLTAMERAGLAKIPVGCRGGGCGVCKVEVLAGTFRCGPMSGGHVSEVDQACGRVLACRLVPESDMEIRVLGKLFRDRRQG